MARDYSKQQTYYKVTIYFKNGTKTYTIRDKNSLDDFLQKTHQRKDIIHYIVESISKFIYAQYRFNG